MSRSVLVREEFRGATLKLGRQVIDLEDYATTGLRVVAVGPSGAGKTGAGLLIGEQLAQQGWVTVIVDPEGELESMYGRAVASPEELAHRLKERDYPFVVVSAPTAEAFVEYGEIIMAAADDHRKPIFLLMDEGQLFSASKKRKKDCIGEASDLVNGFFERGRKRALDLFITAHGYSGTLHRSVFRTKNLTLIGCQEDPTAWSSLAPVFRGTKIGFSELMALSPGEFFCFSRTGVEKVKLQMATALAAVAPKARQVRATLPSTFTEWNRAMKRIPDERLMALDRPMISLLSQVAGLSTQQLLSGNSALEDELAGR